MIRNFKELKVWEKAHKLTLEIYEVTSLFPKEEIYGLVSQMRRCSVSVSANIVEGCKRQTTLDFCHFLNIAEGSLEELKYYSLLSRDLKFLNEKRYEELMAQCEEVGRMINSLISSLKKKKLLTAYRLPLVLLLTFLTAYRLALSADFSSRGAGTSGAAFLKLGAGARPVALGEAYTAVANDANAIYWNTAGLASLKKNEFVAMRAELFQGLQYHFFAFAHPTKRFGTFGLGVNNLNVSGIEQRSEDTDNPEGTVSANDSAYTLAYGLNLPAIPILGEGLKIGAGAKFIRQTLSGSAANAFAMDIGSLYHFPTFPLSIGLSLQNLGTSVKFKDASDPLPLTMKLGGSYRLGENWRISGKGGFLSDEEEQRSGGLLLSLDLNIPRDNNPSLRFGSEFTRIFGESFSASLRGAGYQLAKSGDGASVSGIGGTLGLSAGMGVTWRFLTFDFAWKPFKELGDTYRYSVRLRF